MWLHHLHIRMTEKDKDWESILPPSCTFLSNEMKNVIMKPETNECDLIFPEIISQGRVFSESSAFLCKKIDDLMSLNFKNYPITPILEDLEDIKMMLTSLLEPIFAYAKDPGRPLTKTKEEKETFATVTTMLNKAACFIYLSFVGDMDDHMVLSLKNISSDLIVKKTQIIKMYHSLDIDLTENRNSDIYLSLWLLEWNKNCYLGTESGVSLEDHFMSIKHGLQFLENILQLWRDGDLNLCIQHLVATLNQKLYSLTHSQEDENLLVKLEHTFGELRKEMENVVIKPRNNGYVTLLPENMKEKQLFNRTIDFLLEKIKNLVTSSCKADQIDDMMNDLEELMKNLASLKQLLDNVMLVSNRFTMKEEEEIFAALRAFLDRATCLIYLSFVGKLRVISLSKNFSSLFEELERKDISFISGIGFKDYLASDINISLSILKRREEYHMCTLIEGMLLEEITSLTNGIECLKWILKIYEGRDMENSIILLAQILKQKLESLTYKQTNVDEASAYLYLREEMKKMFTKQETGKYDIIFPDLNISYIRGDNDFLIEKITTLVTSNCKADQIAPLKAELEQLRNMLISLKPLDLYNCGLYERVSTIHHKATILIYLSFVAQLDLEMVLSVKSNILTAIKEIDVWKMYSVILNEILPNIDYPDEDLYLLENIMFLLKGNAEFFNDQCSQLYDALVDVHIFVRGQSPNVILRKLHLLQPSVQAILSHSIPIVCSCYIEHTRVDISAKLNCVFDLIKHIKAEAAKTKLYYFPRVDDLGFLEFFLGYLEGLIKNNEISMKEEIHALHFEVRSLFSLAKETNQQLDKTHWSDIMNMTYQAEYIVDLYLVSSHRDLGLISSLSKIIKQLQNIKLHNIRADTNDTNDAVTLDLSSLYKPGQGVVGKTTQLGNNDAIVGLLEETKNITEYLLNGGNDLDVISIVGMAGVGKTTLALTLYKTCSMADHFDILAWCTVSQNYKSKDLFHTILDQVNAPDKSHRSIPNEQDLADQFCRSLKKRRYLIVLDDIWDTTLLIDLKRYLPHDRVCSRILITTRNSDVCYQIGSKVNQLYPLSKENSWALFQKKMLEKESLSGGLLKISEGIVESCKGLPLSVIIIAGILADIERTEKRWNQIAESVNSLVLSDPQAGCKGILELSYNHLPNHLRSCFLYLGSFPEDQEISVNQLITIWIGEGLVRDTKSHSAEEVAEKYMEDLIAKSLVIPMKERSRGGVKTFRLHDLLRDFCLDKAKEMHFLTVLDYRNQSRPLQDPRRLVINGHLINYIHFSCHSIRSMIWFERLYASDIEKRIEFCDMVLVHVLELDIVQSDSFPNISSLVHLRYLALGLPIWRNSVLPSSISRLRNLQILILRCKYVVVVPDLIWGMGKLRHVDISPSTLFQVDSNRLQKPSFLLENLRYLSNARILRGDSEWLGKLSGLQRLCCVFFADGIEEEDDALEVGYDLEEYENLEDDDDVYVDDISQKDDLEEDDALVEDDNLEEVVGVDDFTEVAEDVEDNQFQMLSCNSNLTSLKVRNAADKKQRFFRTCQLPKSLRELTLSKFFLTSNDISNIGRALPQLEVLKIYSCYVPSGCEWNVDENFPKLKVLKLRDLEISKWIASENRFPSLKQLWVEKCDYLDEIPLDFGDLPNLLLISVRECPDSVDKSAIKIEKWQHDQQNKGMKVHIHHKR